MSKKYAKRAGRSRRKPAKDLEGFDASVDPEAEAVQLSLPIADVLENVRSGIEDLCSTAGLLVMKTLVDDEVEGLAGEKGRHGSSALRWGHDESTSSSPERSSRSDGLEFALATAQSFPLSASDSSGNRPGWKTRWRSR